MNWLEIWQVYLGLKTHFEKDDYDYLKYGPIRISEQTAMRHYTLLCMIERKGESRDAFESRLISIFRYKSVFLNELYSEESEQMFRDYKTNLMGINYYLGRDIKYLCEEGYSRSLDFRSMFFAENDLRVPLVIQMLQRGGINYHSVACLASIIPFCDRISQILFDVRRLKKYMELHEFDKNKIVAIVKPHMENVL